MALECGIPCSKPTCYFCRTGRYNACPDVVFFSTPPYHGTLRRYHVHPEAWLHPLPDSLTYEEGSLLEPLSVALAGIERSGLHLGDALVICGAGPIGLVTLLAAHAAGAAPIVITDLDENRLLRAKELVPRVRTVTVNMKEDAKALGARIVDTLGEEAKLVLECTGVESSIHAAIYVSHRANISPPEKSSLTYRTGLCFWRIRLRYWRGESEPKHPLHASLLQRDRSPLSISISRHLPESDKPSHAGLD